MGWEGDLATINDVARLAGVSPATVSRVINGHSSVDPTLAQRVHRAVEQLGYRPSRVARSLRTHRAAVWGLVISDIRNPFFTDMARGVEDAAMQRGYSVVLCNTDEDRPKEQAYIDLAVDERMTGVIISPASAETDGVRRLIAADIPVVLVDRRLDLPVDSVVIDNVGGARSAVEHLVERGYRRIACISGPSQTSTGQDRAAGYVAALGAAGLPTDPDLLVYANFRTSGGYDASDRLLGLPKPPDAMFVANNLMTLGALSALRARGVQAPGQMGIVGFDDIDWADLLSPSLTTIGQPTYEIGREAAQLLVARLDGDPSPPQHVVLTPILRPRASSAGPVAT